MRIALHGLGKMGSAVERLAAAAGHEVTSVLRRGSPLDAARNADVVVDFSQADGVEHAIAIAAAARVPVVIGTTGWYERLSAVRALVERSGIGCVWASNFSPGANVMSALARRAGELFARFPQYECGMEERHHSRKRDAPSGTALTIAGAVREGSNGVFDPPIAHSRVGSEFGLHTLFFDSPDDLVEISHRARGREGFARGAILAAELIQGKKGFFRFDELISG